MSEEHEDKNSKNIMLSYTIHLKKYRNEWMGATALLISIIGVAPIVWDWALADRDSEIYVRYDPFAVYVPGDVTGPSLNGIAAMDGAVARSKLPDPPIVIKDTSGETITKPIWDMEVTVWNGGASNINGDEIRQPLMISFPGVSKILGIRILHASQRDGIQIEEVLAPIPTVRVRWQYMDRGAGLKFSTVIAVEKEERPRAQIYYTGKLVDANKPTIDKKWPVLLTTLSLTIICIIAIITFARYFPSPFNFLPIPTLISAMILIAWLLSNALLPASPPFK